MLSAESVASDGVESGVLRARGALTMSERIWGLDWSKVLPWQFEGATLELGTFDEATAFMAEHYGSIFGADDRFYGEQMTEAKRRFCAELDVFVFRSAGRVVGIATAHPTDWSTYYVRTFALLPEFRDRRWCSDWIRRICAPLRAVGCERWECECSPANAPMMRMLTAYGSVVTASVSSERWGQMLRFTKFMSANADAVYRRQFIYAPRYEDRSHPTPPIRNIGDSP